MVGKKRQREISPSKKQGWFRKETFQYKKRVKQKIVRLEGFRGQSFYGVRVAHGSIISDGMSFFSNKRGMIDIWVVAENGNTSEDAFVCYPKQFAVIDATARAADPQLISAFKKWLKVDAPAEGVFQLRRPFKVCEREYVKCMLDVNAWTDGYYVRDMKRALGAYMRTDDGDIRMVNDISEVEMLQALSDAKITVPKKNAKAIRKLLKCETAAKLEAPVVEERAAVVVDERAAVVAEEQQLEMAQALTLPPEMRARLAQYEVYAQELGATVKELFSHVMYNGPEQMDLSKSLATMQLARRCMRRVGIMDNGFLRAEERFGLAMIDLQDKIARVKQELVKAVITKRKETFMQEEIIATMLLNQATARRQLNDSIVRSEIAGAAIQYAPSLEAIQREVDGVVFKNESLFDGVALFGG